MTRTQVSFDDAMYGAAKREARRQGISFAELCRRSIARVLGERLKEAPWMRYAGIMDSGDPNASRSVNEVVYGRRRP